MHLSPDLLQYLVVDNTENDICQRLSWPGAGPCAAEETASANCVTNQSTISKDGCHQAPRASKTHASNAGEILAAPESVSGPDASQASCILITPHASNRPPVSASSVARKGVSRPREQSSVVADKQIFQASNDDAKIFAPSE